MSNLHYLNNQWVKEAELKISAFDISVGRGFGIFDFLRTYRNNQPFRLDDHLDRLFNSARELGITVPKTKREIVQLIAEGLVKNNYPETYIKILITGGVSSDGVTPGQPSFIIMFTPAHEFPPEIYKKGAKILTAPNQWVFPKAKSTNYLAAVVYLQKAAKQEAMEVLYVEKDGTVTECTRSNIFIVNNQQLITPKDEVLAGITKKVVIELAKKSGIEVEEKRIILDELIGADEVFFTSSGMEVVPVVQVDDKTIKAGRVGPFTQKIISLFQTHTRG